MIRLIHLAATLLLSCAIAVGAEESPLDQLHADLVNVESMQGAFTQKQYSEEGELLAQSSGRFAILRPGFFRWEINLPDSQLRQNLKNKMH